MLNDFIENARVLHSNAYRPCPAAYDESPDGRTHLDSILWPRTAIAITGRGHG